MNLEKIKITELKGYNTEEVNKLFEKFYSLKLKVDAAKKELQEVREKILDAFEKEGLPAGKIYPTNEAYPIGYYLKSGWSYISISDLEAKQPGLYNCLKDEPRYWSLVKTTQDLPMLRIYSE